MWVWFFACLLSGISCSLENVTIFLNSSVQDVSHRGNCSQFHCPKFVTVLQFR